MLHGGVNITLNFIRSDYWLCKGRKTVREILTKCGTCKKSQSIGRNLVLNRQIFQSFAWISIMHFVIPKSILLVPFMSKIYMEKMIKCLGVTYIYLLVRLRGMFILNWHLVWMPWCNQSLSVVSFKKRIHRNVYQR